MFFGECSGAFPLCHGTTSEVWLGNAARRVCQGDTSPAQPAAPKGRKRKPSAKVLEGRQSLRTRRIAPRSTQNEPPASAAISPEHEGRDPNLEEVTSLIANLKKIITQQISIIANQNSAIDGFRADLAEIKSEQQSLKNQNAEFQQEIRSLQAQLNAFSASLPSNTEYLC